MPQSVSGKRAHLAHFCARKYRRSPCREIALPRAQCRPSWASTRCSHPLTACSTRCVVVRYCKSKATRSSPLLIDHYWRTSPRFSFVTVDGFDFLPRNSSSLLCRLEAGFDVSLPQSSIMSALAFFICGILSGSSAAFSRMSSRRLFCRLSPHTLLKVLQ